MKLIDAFDLVARYRTAWKGRDGWNHPFLFNRNHALRLLGEDRDVSDIKKVDLLEMRCQLQDEPGKKTEFRTNGGVNRIMSMINTLGTELVDIDVLEAWPKLKPLKEKNHRLTYFSKGQIDKLVRVAIEVFDNQDLADAIQFSVFTGCRQGELMEMKVADVDLTHNMVTFRDTKNGDDHVVDIHPELLPVLKNRMALAKGEYNLFDFDSPDQLRSAFYKCRDLIGIDEDHVWHTLRHTTATWLVERGVPIQTIANVLNHKVLTTTQRYAKVSNKSRKSAIELL